MYYLSDDKTPDGLMFHLVEPGTWRLHELTFYRQSSMVKVLEKSLFIEWQQYYIYGDTDQILHPWL